MMPRVHIVLHKLWIIIKKIASVPLGFQELERTTVSAVDCLFLLKEFRWVSTNFKFGSAPSNIAFVADVERFYIFYYSFNKLDDQSPINMNAISTYSVIFWEVRNI